MATRTAPDPRETVRRRLRDDYEFYAANALWIVTKAGDWLQFGYKRPQRRLAAALERQRDAGEPQRAIILKARQVGFSTQAQGMMIQRSTQMENHLAIVLAQDRPTAAALFGIGRTMWARLPEQIKPPIAFQSNTLDRKYLMFGEPSEQLRKEGVLGLNSSVEIQSAQNLVGGRGRTIRTLHISELAFYPPTDKLLGIINGVPDTPASLILKESTAKGENHFKEDWDEAESGGAYYAMFSPWFEEEEYRRPFANEQERGEFHVGGHARWGEDEPDLFDLIVAKIHEWAIEDGVDPPPDELVELRALEHLNWRRWAIPSKTDASVDKFRQEYPSTPEEAFLATGKKVFPIKATRKVLERVARTDPAVPTAEVPGAVKGLFRATELKKVRARAGVTVDVPQGALWVPARKREDGEVANWRIWQAPQKAYVDDDGVRHPDGQYLVSLDPASGQEDEKGTEHAEHGGQIIDHRTRRQVAEFRWQGDPNETALSLLLAALYFNRAWIIVERTGGYGLAMLRMLAIDFRYPRVFEEQSRDKRVEDRSDRLGFSTDHVSKPLLEAKGIELLNTGTDGIQSRALAGQLLSYVRNAKGKTGPEAGKLSDLLMAWLIAQYVASIRPIRPERGPGAASSTSYSARTVRPREQR